MKTGTEQKEHAASRAAFIAARIVVGLFGLLACMFGGLAGWEAIREGVAWYWWILAPAFVVGGLWFIWSAVRPRRENVSDMFTTIVARLLADIF